LGSIILVDLVVKSVPSIENRLLANIRNTMEMMNVDFRGTTILIGVSGGSDSLTLLLLLNKLSDDKGFKIHIGHLDHGLREDSADDAAFVADVGKKLGIPVVLGNCNVDLYRKKKGLSLEEAARDVRYSFLSSTAVEIGADFIAVGHNLDDQVETILMNIIRGGGTNALLGMSYISNGIQNNRDKKLRLLRPILDLSKEDTEKYCLLKSISYLKDSTNMSMRYTRNRVRIDLVPKLVGYNSNFGNNLLKLSEAVSQDLDYINQQASATFTKLCTSIHNGVEIYRSAFNNLHPSMKNHVLRFAYERVVGSKIGLENSHIKDMVKVSRGATGKKVDLPGDLIFRVGYDSLELCHNSTITGSSQEKLEEYSLNVPGKTLIPGWEIEIRFVSRNHRITVNNKYAGVFDKGIVGNILTVRGRRDGDKFQPLGMTGSKKIKKYLSDAKVPAVYRDSIPLVVSDNTLVWIVGYCVSDWASIKNGTSEALEIQFFAR